MDSNLEMLALLLAAAGPGHAAKPGVPLHKEHHVAASVKLDHEEQSSRCQKSGVETRTEGGRSTSLSALVIRDQLLHSVDMSF